MISDILCILILTDCSTTSKTLAKAALWLLGGLGLIGYVSLLKVSGMNCIKKAFPEK